MVIFVPTTAGAKTATVTVTASTGGEAATATLTGSASNPYAVTVAPLTADFSPAPGLVARSAGQGQRLGDLHHLEPGGSATHRQAELRLR